MPFQPCRRLMAFDHAAMKSQVFTWAIPFLFPKRISSIEITIFSKLSKHFDKEFT